MLAAHGLAALYVSPRIADRTRTPYVGYRSVSELFPANVRRFALHSDARHFEEGMPNLLGVSVLENALTLIHDVGIEEIERHNLGLVDRLRAGLRSLDINLLYPDDATWRGSIVAFETEHYGQIARCLQRHGTIVWARDGRVRLSPHSYNTDADVDTALDQLAAFTPGRG